MTFEKVTQQVLWLVIFIILAPILGPRPYGLYSIVMFFVGVCELILLEGSIEALVTIEELDYLHMTTANLTNGGIGLVFALIIAALAPIVGIIFQDDEIRSLMWALSPLPLLSSLSATPLAILRRSLNYKRLAIRSITGLVIGGILGIAMAVSGFGVWALAFQVLGQRAAEFAIAWVSAPVRMGFRWSGVHFRELSPIGMNVFTGLIMSFLGGQLPRIMFGYILGPTELGLFALANRFQELIIQTTVQPLTAVGRIELRDSKPGSAEFEHTFVKVMQNVSLLSFPIFLGGAALVPDLFHIWLDQRWTDGVIPTQAILLGGIPLALFYCIDSAFFAANLSRIFAWTATVQTISISLTVFCVAPWGLDLTCLALAVRPWLLLPIFLVLLRRSCKLPLWGMLSSPIRSLIGATMMGVIISLPYLRPAWLHEVPTFLLLIAIGTAFYFVFLYGFLWNQLKTLMNSLFLHQSRETNANGSLNS